MQITTIGLDIAKNVFQVHGIDATEKVVMRKQLRRRQLIKFFEALAPCLIGMEACATAHYWARELAELFASRCSANASEGCEGLRQAQREQCRRRRGDLRGSQAPNHAVGSGQVSQRTGPVDAASRTRSADAPTRPLINALRAHLPRLGIAAAQGREGVKELLAIVAQDGDLRLPADAHASLIVLAAQLQAVQTMIGSIEKRVVPGSIARTKRASGLRPSPGSALSAPPRSQRPSLIRRFFDRGVILRPE